MLYGPDGGPQIKAAPVTAADLATAMDNMQDGTGTMADQAVIMQGSAANLVAVAGTGFRLTPEAGAALIASVQESISILDSISHEVANLQNAPKLGGTRVAQIVSDFTRRVAMDDQGIVKGIQRLYATLEQMLAAYKKAVANYDEVDQQVHDSLKWYDQAVKDGTLPPPHHGRIEAV